jgi:putative addiction module CopG family antidote
MTITLTPEQEKIITEQIGSGHYRSPEDVITQSLGMLNGQEQFIRTNTAELRDAISSGIHQIKRGEVVDGREAIANLKEKLRRPQQGE